MIALSTAAQRSEKTYNSIEVTWGERQLKPDLLFLPSSSHEQEHGPLAFLRQFWSGRDLLRCRTELLDMPDREARLDEQIESGSNSPMMLHDSLGKPVGRPRALHEIVINGPSLGPSASISQPGFVGAM